MFTNMAYVYAIYKEKSFSKAAEKLHISQPSLSATIKKIEQKIGAQIFDRSCNPVRLTDCGREYIHSVEAIMDVEIRFENYVSELLGLVRGSLTIGASNFFTSFILPPVLSRFQQAYPGVSISLIEADTSRLEKMLFSGELDFIVDNYQFDIASFRKKLYFSEHLLIAAPINSKSNERAKEYSLSLADIKRGKHLTNDIQAAPLSLFAQEPFVSLRDGNDTRERLDKIFAQNNLQPNIVLELDQLITSYHFACYGMGLSLVSDTLIKQVPSDQEAVYYKIESPHTMRNIYFYYKVNKFITRPMQEFWNTAIM